MSKYVLLDATEVPQSNWNEEDSSSKAYIQNKPDLSLKQDKLTAGTNVTISGSTISSDIPNASSSTLGKVKLYSELGNNTDGTITQETLNILINRLENAYDRGCQKNAIFDHNATNLGTISNATEAEEFVNDYHITTGKFGSLMLNQRITISGSALDGTNAEWVIAGFDTYYNVGTNHPITAHHLGLIPSTHLGKAVMNDTNTTVGGYVGSKMHTDTMATVTTKLRNTLGTHILMGDRRLSNAMTASLYNRYGSADGASSGWDWYDTYAELLTENQVYGSIAWSSSGFDTGEGKEQLPIFRFVNTTYLGRFNWWLRSVSNSIFFAYIYSGGYANDGGASANYYVRPLIFLG